MSKGTCLPLLALSDLMFSMLFAVWAVSIRDLRNFHESKELDVLFKFNCL